MVEEILSKRFARRTFLAQAGRLAAAAAALEGGACFGEVSAMAASRGEEDLVRDTLSGFVAFVVPGPDEYSVAQGVSTSEPGGLDAHTTDFLIAALNLSASFVPSFASQVAGILNEIASQINPGASGPFPSAFARLSFAEKATVLSVMEGLEPLKPLAGVLPAVVAFIAYSEAPVFDPVARTVAGEPIGWSLSRYDGVADGRNDFHGYFRHHRAARS